MLHVHCGDSSAEALRNSGLPGEVLSWCELYTSGPVPSGMPDDDFLALRASVLSDSTGGAISPESCLGRLKRQEQVLKDCAKHDEVILWFDACLYDQLILAHHLDFFANTPQMPGKLSLICIAEFSGHERFAGLGELSPDELAGLFPQRTEITPVELGSGQYIWGCFRGLSPGVLLSLYEHRERLRPILPFMADAILRLLEELPSTFNGLSRLEREILATLVQGSLTLPGLFKKVSDMETRPFFGDTQLWRQLRDLSEMQTPLVSVSGPGPLPLWKPSPHSWSDWTAAITPNGEDVLFGRKNHLKLNGIDRWIGGTHISPEKLYLWDSEEKTLRVEGKEDAF